MSNGKGTGRDELGELIGIERLGVPPPHLDVRGSQLLDRVAGAERARSGVRAGDEQSHIATDR